MQLYSSQQQLEELASWAPDSTGLVGIIIASNIGAPGEYLAAFPVSLNCGSDDKAKIFQALQLLFRVAGREHILVPAFESYALAEKRLDELYDKNYREVVSVSAKTIYDARRYGNIPHNRLTGEPIKILSAEDSKKFERALSSAETLKDIYQITLRGLEISRHNPYATAGIRQIRLRP